MGRYGDSFIRFAGDFDTKYFIGNSELVENLLKGIVRDDIIDIKGLGRFSVLDNWKHWTKTDKVYNEIILRKQL